MNLSRILEQLGYSSHEAIIYLAMLELGASHVSSLAQKVNLPRSSVQIILEKLKKDGLTNFYIQKRYKYWVAENPKLLLEHIRKHEELLLSAIPEFLTLQRKKKDSAILPMKVLIGREMLKNVLSELVKEKYPLLAILPSDTIISSLHEDAIWDSFVKEQYEHFLRIKILTSNTIKGKELLKNANKNSHEIRFLIDYFGEAAFFISEKKSIIILAPFNQPTIVVLENKEISGAFSHFFDNLWNTTPLQENKTDPFTHSTDFKTLIENSSLPILITNNAIEICYVNQAWEKQFQKTLYEIKGKNPKIIQNEQEKYIFEKIWEKFLQNKLFQFDELLDYNKNGEFFSMFILMFSIKIHGLSYYVQIVIDNSKEAKMKELEKKKIWETNAKLNEHFKKIELLEELVLTTNKELGLTLKNEIVALKKLLKKVFHDRRM